MLNVVNSGGVKEISPAEGVKIDFNSGNAFIQFDFQKASEEHWGNLLASLEKNIVEPTITDGDTPFNDNAVQVYAFRKETKGISTLSDLYSKTGTIVVKELSKLPEVLEDVFVTQTKAKEADWLETVNTQIQQYSDRPKGRLSCV